MTMKPCGRQPQKSSPCRCALRVDRPEARRTEDGGAVVWYGRNWRAAEDVRPYQATTLLRRRAAENVRPYQKKRFCLFCDRPKAVLCVLWQKKEGGRDGARPFRGETKRPPGGGGL